MKILISRGIGYSMFRFMYPSDIEGIDAECDAYGVYEPALIKIREIDL